MAKSKKLTIDRLLAHDDVNIILDDLLKDRLKIEGLFVVWNDRKTIHVQYTISNYAAIGYLERAKHMILIELESIEA